MDLLILFEKWKKCVIGSVISEIEYETKIDYVLNVLYIKHTVIIKSLFTPFTKIKMSEYKACIY